MNAQDITRRMRRINEEVIGLLFNRYVFRTHQEIVRLNPNLQGRPRCILSEWAQFVYAQAASIGVRRLAAQESEPDDVSLVGLIDLLIQDPNGLWECFSQHCPEDATLAWETEAQKGTSQDGLAISACRRLLGEDRRVLISAARKAVHFASKRVAHSVPDVQVNTTFFDLDDAIDTVTATAEKYSRLLLARVLRGLDPLDGAQRSDYMFVVQLGQHLDLFQEMKRSKLAKGWDEIFLEPWASPETINLPLGEMAPPRLDAGR